METLPNLEDDDLETPEVGSWAEDKYRLVRNYASVFATSMKRKWECRVYIDLFAAAGRSRIEGMRMRVVPASPLLALGIPDRFDRYIFCEEDPVLLGALRTRIGREFPEVDTLCLPGDVNEKVESLLAAIPRHRAGFRVLSFCFADPFACSNLKFSTIRGLAERYMDFLILIPSGMDANRNRDLYLKTENKTLDEFFGTAGWRAAWASEERSFRSFGDFVTDFYGRRMREMGYKFERLEDAEHVRSTEKNLRLYDLAFFSRHELGERFWREVRKYANPQGKLFN